MAGSSHILADSGCPAVADASRAPAGSPPDRRTEPEARSGPPLKARVLGATAGAIAVLAVRLPVAHAYVAAVLAAALVVLALEDLARRVIPNRIVLPATVLVLAGQLAISPGDAASGLIAGIAAALFFALPSLINPALVGMGDAKLALLIGVGLGAQVIDALVIGLVALLPVAVYFVIFGAAKGRRASLPLAPFLALGALVVLLVPIFR